MAHPIRIGSEPRIVEQLGKTEAMIVRLVNTGMTDFGAKLEEIRRKPSEDVEE